MTQSRHLGRAARKGQLLLLYFGLSNTVGA